MSAEIVSYSAAERAAQIILTGRKVLEHQGIHFVEAQRGFYWPIKLAAPLRTFPRSLPGAYGHKVVVADAAQANATLHLMLADDIPNYSLEQFSRDRRKGVRRALKAVEVRPLESPLVLAREGGYEISCSFHERTEWGQMSSRSEYEATLERWELDKGMVWFGGYVEGALGGYISVSVADGYGTMGTIATHSDFLNARINDALVYELARRCQESGVVNSLAFGLYCQKKSLNQFKESMLFRCHSLPSYAHVRWPMKLALRMLRPAVYRRVYGLDRGTSQDAAEPADRGSSSGSDG